MQQLQPNGRMVVPIDDGDEQNLWRIVRNDSGAISRGVIGRTRFVPLIFEGAQELNDRRHGRGNRLAKWARTTQLWSEEPAGAGDSLE